MEENTPGRFQALRLLRWESVRPNVRRPSRRIRSPRSAEFAGARVSFLCRERAGGGVGSVPIQRIFAEGVILGHIGRRKSAVCHVGAFAMGE